MTKHLYSAIGDNTEENREWLEKVGYKLNIRASDKELSYIYTEDGDFHLIDSAILIHVKNQDCSIDCIGNPHLFRAITALREDSDYMQLFFAERRSLEPCSTKDNPVYGTYNDLILCEDLTFNSRLYPNIISHHKLTKDELINHFK